MRPLDWITRLQSFMATKRLDVSRAAPDRQAQMADIRDDWAIFTSMLPSSTLLTVSREMVDVLQAAAASFPVHDLHPEDLPWGRCLALFESPVRLLLHHPDTPDGVYVDALQWYTSAGDRPFKLLMPDGLERPAVAATWYMHYDDFPPLPGIRTDWPFGVCPEGTAEIKLSSRRLMGALWALVQQRIAVASPQQPDRAEARRWERSMRAPIPEILNVTLRMASPRNGDDPEHHPVGWSHRWLVGGHWRQQWYPSVNDHRPIWIAPHVKGPDGKPLVLKERVYAWNR